MNSKEFIKALRQVIREEVQEAVKTEFAINQVLMERSSVKKPAQVAPQQPVRYTESMKPKKQPVNRTYSENDILNSILKETAEEPISSDFSALLTEGYEGGEHDEWPTMMGGMRTIGNVDTPRYVEQPVEVEGQEGVPDHVFNAMNRDYSAVLKAAKAKSKIGR